jgi:ribonuclease-3
VDSPDGLIRAFSRKIMAGPERPFSESALPEIDRERKKVLALFQKNAAIRFKSFKLLNLSFTHRSVANESRDKHNNERLEFLGDAILGAVTASLLYDVLADKAEGELAKVKSVVVSEDVLSVIARELGIDSLLLLSRGEELTGGRGKNAILADALEALIGALYLDSGYKAAFTFVSRFMGPEIIRVIQNRHQRDYKSLLQELTLGRFKKYPVYHMVRHGGPDHARFFLMEVAVDGQTFGPGMGKNKKNAEQEAAKMAYQSLTGETAPTGTVL